MNKLILTNIYELVTCRGKAPKCGSDMNDVGIIHNACVVIEGERISAVGSNKDILARYDICDYTEINCSGKAVLPGFIDSHTHFVFGGYRNEEFSMRLDGSSYMDIQNAGGGIASTVESTRNASIDELIETGLRRADSMLSFGVTTVEGKSGYGLDSDTEIKQLKAMKQINRTHPIDIVSTFMGAHSVPKEYKGREIEYLKFLINRVLPTVKIEKLAEFVDIFCEQGVFSIEQSKFYLSKVKEMGFKLKMHADEIVQTGGAELSAELNAISADHLLNAAEKGIEDMAKSGVIATLLPATAFNLKENYADARYMIKSGCAVALATDFNPGSSFTNSIPLVIALAALNMGMNIREIVTALTINGACAIDCQSEIGSIEKGKKADIIILDYPSIDFLSYHTCINIIKTVIKNGNVV
ncbi:MAG: imidazolonepropionase, partial [Clostridiales bacterium]|nr:imidazolonepropionase [Clostridiales bacterium]